jgi:putative ABC transport system permease protein
MFFTYLRRELRRRMRQAVFIALGLALGVGLVITVTAASAGVKNAQGTVLHALYGVGTDVTVTKTPKAGSFTPGSFGFGFQTGTRQRPAAGTKINTSTLSAGPTLASISESSVSTVSGLSPKLSAVVGQTTGSATPGGSRQFGFGPGGGGGGVPTGGPGAGAFRPAAAASHTVAVHLTAAVSANVILLAVVLAVAGGIIAGIFGGWRAARLRPAAALAKVG